MTDRRSVGGLFIPLMASGAVIGRLFADATSTGELALFVIVGAASMLGAGYAAPLTAVGFVAEYTGQAALIVPACWPSPPFDSSPARVRSATARSGDRVDVRSW